MQNLRTLFRKIFFPPTSYSVASHSTRLRNASAQVGGMGERELQLRMEMLVDQALREKSVEVFETSKKLAMLSLTEQNRFMQAVTRLQAQSDHLAYCFCCYGSAGLQALQGNDWGKWLGDIEATLHANGEQAACVFLQDIQVYLQKISLPAHAVCLNDIAPLLEKFLTALSGRRLAVHANQSVYTNTKSIYLPKTCSHFDSYKENFNLYKVWTAYLWAQNQFQTWNFDHKKLLYDYGSSSDAAFRLFQVLENLRLDYKIEQELPGIARLIKQLKSQESLLPPHPAWDAVKSKLFCMEASANDSIDCLDILLKAKVGIPQATLYQGTFKPEETLQIIQARLEKNREALREELTEYLRKFIDKNKKNFAVETTRAPSLEFSFTLKHDENLLEMTPEIQALLESIAQDIGEVPQEYLENIAVEETSDKEKNEAALTPADDENTYVCKMPEWDYSIDSYRNDWCSVYLEDSPLGQAQFAQDTLRRYHHTVKQLRKTFEALRDKDTRLFKQIDGDEIDLERAIESIIDTRCGVSTEQSIYIRNKKEARNIAVSFMVDASSSTSGWINQLEKEALVLLCESLEVLGDRYAIHGFSSQSRKRCKLQRIKSFEEPYDIQVQKKIAGLTAKNHTRMGAAVRFLAKNLLSIEAKTHLLIILSDGKPEDMDGYRGRYGIEDTRKALMEASHCGIHSYCITIDTKDNDYLPYMYSQTHYSIVQNIEQLPFKISDIYQHITR